MPRKNYVSRTSRIEAYARMEGPRGESRDPKNLDYWEQRASTNSQIAPRASDGPMKLPSTKMTVRDTGMKPKEARSANARMVAKDDLDHVGSGSYMPGVRRES